jgi:superfamily II DNA or RNA helicase
MAGPVLSSPDRPREVAKKVRAYGRDRRRRLTVADRRILFEKADGLCQRCGVPLAADWHSAHLVAYSNGGATTLENMEAWCPPCNLRLGAADVSAPPVELRPWQAYALPEILARLFQTGRATLHAAPGAGKTIFTGAVFHHLAEVDLVDRMLVVVPNRVLVHQWRDALGASLRILLDDEPGDGFLEHPETVGCIVTYSNLVGAARNHRVLMEAASTLVVFDEVHHLADQRSWGRAAVTMTGGAEPVATVLNTTGTLFRSTGREQIPTVDYDEIVDDSGRPMVQARADISVTADQLIGRELRPVDLHACGSTIELVDLREEDVISGEVADLSNQKLMRAAHARMIEKPEWMEGFAAHMWSLLRIQSAAIDHAEPLKALWVARNQRAARTAATIIDRVVGVPGFARLVISDESQSLRTLRQAVTDDRACCIVAVQMVTEGFDCPQVSTIAYAHNITADLYLTQMVARAMRLTSTERQLGRVLPAHVLIPDVQDLRRAFADVLVSKLHTLVIDEEEEPTDDGPGGGGDRLPRFDLNAVTAPRLEDIVVVGETDGVVGRPEHDAMTTILDGLGVPEVYAARMVVGARRFSADRVLHQPHLPFPTGDVAHTPAHPREINKLWRGRITQRANWWAINGNTDIKEFQADANSAANIGRGGRDRASVQQLARVVDHMNTRIRRHCNVADIDPPGWLEETD